MNRSDKFNTKFFYAFKNEALTVKPIDNSDSGTVTYNVYGFKKKKGEWAITKGEVRSWLRDGLDRTAFADIIDDSEGTRYGAKSLYVWDGVSLWSHDNVFDTMIEAHKDLKPLLEAFIASIEANENPQPPAGYLGWFNISEE